MRRFGRVLASHSAHLKQLFGAAVPRLKHFIPKRPRGRDAIPVFERREVPFSVADQHGAVELRVTANVVVVPWIKAPPVRVKPSLDRTKDTALEDRPRVARRGMRAEMEATLKNRDARAAAGKAVGDSGPADPGANDRHINCVGQVTHSSDPRGACCSLYLKQQREADRKVRPCRAAVVGRTSPPALVEANGRKRRVSPVPRLP